MKSIFFTPGPAELYFTVEDHIKDALDKQIPSISHRSKDFEAICSEATQNLKGLLGIPEGFHIFFTGSATEIWERVIENNVENKSYHYVNGAFSKRFYEAALDLNRKADKKESEQGQCPEVDLNDIDKDVELVACTQNETSTGVAQPVEEIHKIHDQYPDKFLAVDAVSALPYISLDYSKIDTVLFSVQKGFGLPAGLGIWVVSERSVEKATKLKEKGFSIGTYHSLPSLIDKGAKNQTPETPNVLNIYLLAKVCEDMMHKGIELIRRETEQKAALLYNMIENHPLLSPFVKEEKHRSKTVIIANTEVASSEIINYLKQYNLVVGGGYGKLKDSQIRIANFPTHSKEQVELLIDKINEFESVTS